jgi:hypothetical protein
MTIMALLPVGLQSSSVSRGDSVATSIMNAVVSDLRATGPTSPLGSSTTSQEFGIPIPASGTTSQTTLFFTSDGASSSVANANSTYQVTITFLSTAGGRAATPAVAKVTWPVNATAKANASSVETLVALDRN